MALRKLKQWYERNERRIGFISLVGGFLVDSFTLNRIDNWKDDVWIAFHLLLSALYIILLNKKKKPEESFWLPNLLQFSFGALFGSSFVFYLRATTFSVTWPFLAMLFFAALANEFFQERYEKLTLQLAFFYFSLFSFSIFILPIMVGKIGPWIFVLSGILSLLIVWLFVRLLIRVAKERFLESRTKIRLVIIGMFAAINVLYFTNLIPPIPLSMKDAGVYHYVDVNAQGHYLLTGEARGVEKYFTFYPTVYWQAGEALSAYSAVYAPGRITTDIVHEWQYQSANGEWQTSARIPLEVHGGRSDGFRTFSTKYNFTPGKWRVNIETVQGQIIGRINFKIVVGKAPALVTTLVQ